MTPAINIVKKLGISHVVHQYAHDQNHKSYGIEAAEKLGLPPEQIFKTLVIMIDKSQLIVAVIPVEEQLSMKLLAKAAGAKKAAMADKNDVQKSTGYILGGVSPIGQKKKLLTFIDSTAQDLEHVYVSAGKRGLEIELSPLDLIKVTGGSFAKICQYTSTSKHT